MHCAFGIAYRSQKKRLQIALQSQIIAFVLAVSFRKPSCKIDFINLPSECTIKIFTLSGYLVDTIQHQSGYESGAATWDLLSKDGLEIAYGIYLYHIDAPGIGETTGKFAVIK